MKMDKVSGHHTALPLVSVIIPSGDSHSTIKAAIDSVLAQSYTPIEIIVVLNGEVGVTLSIISGYKGVNTFRLPEANAYEARAYGASMAKGQYLLYLDADDCLHKDAVMRAVTTALANSADIVQLRLVQFARKAGINFHWHFPCRYDTTEAFRGIVADHTIFNPGIPAKLYRRSLIATFPDIKYKGFWGEDRLFNMLVFSGRPKVMYSPESIYYYRYGGMSRDLTRKGLTDEISRVKELQTEYLRANNLQSYIPDVEREHRFLLEAIERYKSPDILLRLKLLIARLLS
jgi:putative beta1,3-glucosyltransferase waaV